MRVLAVCAAERSQVIHSAGIRWWPQMCTRGARCAELGTLPQPSASCSHLAGHLWLAFVKCLGLQWSQLPVAGWSSLERSRLNMTDLPCILSLRPCGTNLLS